MTERETERVFAPAYFREFVCDGAACGSRCCGGWSVPVDASTRRRWEALPQDARREIFSGISGEEAGWKTRHRENGNCFFLGEDGLCKLQKRYGEEYLPDICDAYPRVSYRFDGFIERSLTPTCPVAARLMLLRETPMDFVALEVPPRRGSSVTRPPMEALRWENRLQDLQRRAIALLQDRTRSFRQRFLSLGRFLAILSTEFGEGLPTKEELSGIKPELPETTPRVEGFSRLRYMAALLAELYEALDAYPPGRLDELARRLARDEAEIETALRKRHGHILENFAVNEWFLRLFPFACVGDFLTNYRFFLLRFRLVEFSLLMDTAANGGVPDTERTLLMVDRVSERLYHNRDADEMLKRHAGEDFGSMDPENFLARL